MIVSEIFNVCPLKKENDVDDIKAWTKLIPADITSALYSQQMNDASSYVSILLNRGR